MTHSRCALATFAAVFSAPLLLHGQTGDDNVELAAVRKTAQAYVEAFDRGDAKAVASFWAEDGQYVDQTGAVFQGREAIEKAFEEYFKKSPGAKLQLHIESLHAPEPNVAIEVGDSTVVRGGQQPAERARYRAVHIKQDDGSWKLQSVHEGPGLPPSNYEHLKDLAWMLGDWTDEEVSEDDSQPAVAVHTQTRWSVHRNFLLRAFTATLDNRVVLTGTQRIGWYAPKKQIRSWTFDSDGGMTVGIWTKQGEQWIVQAEHVDREGKISKEKETVVIDDLHSHTWRITQRKLDGKQLPDQVVKVRRMGTKKP